MNKPLEVGISSNLEGRLDRAGNPLVLENGFLPFQAEGVRFMKDQERCVFFRCSTGTGKTVMAEGTILWKFKQDYDLVFFIVNANNTVNTQRKIKEHTSLDSIIFEGSQSRRDKILDEIDRMVINKQQPIMIFNAEKVREDKDLLKELITHRRLLVIYDEITKFSNRGTALYRSLCEVLWTSYIVNRKGKTKRKIYYPMVGKERASVLFSVGMSATPITNSPEGFFNCVRLLDSTIFGSVADFNNNFVAERDWYDNVVRWKNLDLMRKLVKPIIYDADKDDPEIAIQFPKKAPPEIIYCDLDKNSQKLYKILQKEYDNMGDYSILSYQDILAAIGCFQMICSNPRSVLLSADLRFEFTKIYTEYWVSLSEQGIVGKKREKLANEFTKKYSIGSKVAMKLVDLVGDKEKFTDIDKNGNPIVSKLQTLEDLLLNHTGKAVVFTTMNEMGIPILSDWLKVWGIKHVSYHGALNAKDKQLTLDKFRSDPSIKVFLSTDAGSDSIDLPEATLTIHYDLPPTWAKIVQRENRQDRIDSVQDEVRVVTLVVPNSVEDRKMGHIARKKGYHDTIFKSEETEMEKEYSRGELLYQLTGNEDLL